MVIKSRSPVGTRKKFEGKTERKPTQDNDIPVYITISLDLRIRLVTICDKRKIKHKRVYKPS